MEDTTKLHRSAKELLAEADQLMRGKSYIDDDFPVLDSPIPPRSAQDPARHAGQSHTYQQQSVTPLGQNFTISPVGQDIQPS
ncbi:MAG: hypothetical protein RLZZ502_1863, partial [Pseudomonadota bacterium]